MGLKKTNTMKQNTILFIVVFLMALFACSVPCNGQNRGKKLVKEVIVTKIVSREGSSRVNFEATDKDGTICHVNYWGYKSPLVALEMKVIIYMKPDKDYHSWNIARIKPIFE